MEVVAEELGTLIAPMSVKDCEVADRHLRVQLQVLNTLIRVFHALSLSNVAHHSRVKSLHLELEGADAE